MKATLASPPWRHGIGLSASGNAGTRGQLVSVGAVWRRCALVCRGPARLQASLSRNARRAGSTRPTMAAIRGHALTQLEGRNDLVIDHISIDPAAPEHMILAAFASNRPGGGLYISDDGGKHWAKVPEMHGQSVRSLTRAASDPNILVAGTLQGSSARKDNGKHWELISPAGSTRDSRDRVGRHRPEGPQHHLRGHVASAVEDGRRRSALAEHQAGHHR